MLEITVGLRLKRARQYMGVDSPKGVGVAGLDVLQYNLGRTEKMGIDGVKVVVVTREDRRKRLAVVARRRRGNLRAELDQAWVVAGNRQNDPSAIEDSVV